MSNWREIAAYTRKDAKRIGSAAREKARQLGEGMKIGAQVSSIAGRIAGNVKEKRDLDDFASSYDLKYDKKTDKYYSSGEDSEKIQLTRSQIKTIYDNPELDFKESVYLDGKAKDRFKFKETQEKNTFLDKLTKGIGDLFSSTDEPAKGASVKETPYYQALTDPGKALDYGKAVAGTAEYRAKEFGKKVGEKIGDTVHSVKEDINLAKLANLQESTEYRETGGDLYSMFEAGLEDPSLVAGYDQTSDTMSMLNLHKYGESLTHSSELLMDDPMLYDTVASPYVYSESLMNSSELPMEQSVPFDNKAYTVDKTYKEGLKSSSVDMIEGEFDPSLSQYSSRTFPIRPNMQAIGQKRYKALFGDSLNQRWQNRLFGEKKGIN